MEPLTVGRSKAAQNRLLQQQGRGAMVVEKIEIGIKKLGEKMIVGSYDASCKF